MLMRLVEVAAAAWIIHAVIVWHGVVVRSRRDARDRGRRDAGMTLAEALCATTPHDGRPHELPCQACTMRSNVVADLMAGPSW